MILLLQGIVRQVRAQSQICSTRYPLLLVHRVGFEDLQYFNYWGRIPRELARYGADIYYGNRRLCNGCVQCRRYLQKMQDIQERRDVKR